MTWPTLPRRIGAQTEMVWMSLPEAACSVISCA